MSKKVDRRQLEWLEARVMIGDQEFVTYPPNSTIRLWRSATPDHYEPHWHSAVEVLIPKEDRCISIVEGIEYTVDAGEMLIIPSGKVHTLTMKRGSRELLLFELDSILVLRDFNVLSSMLSTSIHITKSSSYYEAAFSLLSQIITEYDSGAPLGNMLSYARILELYTLVGRNYLSGIYASNNTSIVKQQAHWEVFNRVMEFLDDNYMSDINLDTVAAEAGFSKFHFTRLFKQYTNTTFYRFICLKRVVMAERLLTYSSRPISEIALQVGFDSISTFNRIYKQLRGCTPTQYKTLHNPSAANFHQI